MLDRDCENLTDIPSPYFPLPATQSQWERGRG